MFARDVSPELEWSPATDDASGLVAYEVESAAASYDGESMTAPRGAKALGPSDLSSALEARPGFTYCYRVIASDGAGNKSSSVSTCTAYPIDDSDLLPAKGRWTTVSKPGAYLDERGTR